MFNNFLRTFETPEKEITKANVGDVIRFKKDNMNGWEGKVDKVNENSVIVSITKQPAASNFPFEATVVNHKRYKIMSA